MRVPLKDVHRASAKSGLAGAVERARCVQEVPLQGFPHLTAGLVILTEERVLTLDRVKG